MFKFKNFSLNVWPKIIKSNFIQDKNVLILEISQNVIKVCQAKTKNKDNSLVYYNAFPLTRDSSDTSNQSAPLSLPSLEQFRWVWEQLPKIKYDRIYLSLSREFFLIKFLKLPSQNKQELKDMLPFQLSKTLPFPPNEIIYDFSIIEPNPELSKIIIFLIQEKSLANLLDFINNYSLSPSGITITSYGIHNWFLNNNLSSKENSTIIIDIDKSSVEFLVVNSASVLFSRSFPYQEEKEILGGINQSLYIFNKEFSAESIDKTIFTGIKCPEVMSKFTIYTSAFIEDNYFLLQKSSTNNPAYSYAALLGLNLKPILPPLDFSPLTIKAKREHLGKQKYIIKISVIILELLIIFGLLLGKTILDKYKYLKLLNNQLQSIKIQAQNLDTFANRLKVIEKEAKKTARFSDMTVAIISAIPQDTQLTFLDFADNGDFSIKGYTQDMSKVFFLVTALNRSSIFNNVKAKYASQIKRESQNVIEFYIGGKFKVTKK